MAKQHLMVYFWLWRICICEPFLCFMSSFKFKNWESYIIYIYQALRNQRSINLLGRAMINSHNKRYLIFGTRFYRSIFCRFLNVGYPSISLKQLVTLLYHDLTNSCNITGNRMKWLSWKRALVLRYFFPFKRLSPIFLSFLSLILTTITRLWF